MIRRGRDLVLLAVLGGWLWIGSPVRGIDEAVESASLVSSLSQGTFHLNLRYRFEHVDDEAFDQDANASTLRTSLAYASAPWRGLWVEVEAENVSEVGFSDQFANAGAGSLNNGVTGRPVVADPELTELNQAFVGLELLGESRIRIGRMEVAQGDQRFLGPVGWRQNHQSFDALHFDGHFAADRLRLSYVRLGRVHRIFGDSKPLDGDALDVGWDLDRVEVGAFAYRLDYERPSDRGQSRWTAGLRAGGDLELGRDPTRLSWRLRVARQEDVADNPVELSLDYVDASLGIGRGSWRTWVGIEKLGSDPEQGSFSTPLATLHKFNGWADRFLATPARGLVDTSLGGSWKRGEWSVLVVVHRFEADTGPGHYGDEVDASVAWATSWGPQLLLKAAAYDADEHSADGLKIWWQAGWGF